ncbi:hypothetical protein AA0X95_26595 [Bacillus sp. 1P10SD]|uniref:hypothetical protein n=1 Tax=Bacillus sp. 1P10SD TaxID=3132265 RepID=UPI0039A6DBF0
MISAPGGFAFRGRAGEPPRRFAPAPQIVTTEEEIEGYAIVKLLLKETIAEERVGYRDNLSYFNILVDNSIRRWVCRLGFNQSQKYIQFNDEGKTYVNIDKVSDITLHREKLIEVAKRFI